MRRKVLLLLAVAASCSFLKSDTYELFVYPDRTNLTKHISVGVYKSEDEARKAARKSLAKFPNGDYEIGKNCKSKPGLTVKVCEKTFR